MLYLRASLSGRKANNMISYEFVSIGIVYTSDESSIYQINGMEEAH